MSVRVCPPRPPVLSCLYSFVLALVLSLLVNTGLSWPSFCPVVSCRLASAPLDPFLSPPARSPLTRATFCRQLCVSGVSWLVVCPKTVIVPCPLSLPSAGHHFLRHQVSLCSLRLQGFWCKLSIAQSNLVMFGLFLKCCLWFLSSFV